MRLIDADKIDFRKVFLGASDFARDTRNAAQELIDMQPTAYDVDKVVEQLENRICDAEKVIVKQPADKLDEIANDTAEAFIEAYKDAIEIIKSGGVANV